MTNATTSPDFHTTIGALLAAEHWTPTKAPVAPEGAMVTAWSSSDRTARVVITTGPDGAQVDILGGSHDDEQVQRYWSLEMTDPAEHQVLAAARAAADLRAREALALVDRLQRHGWAFAALDDNNHDVRIVRGDAERTVMFLGGTDTAPGGWVLNGDDLRASATAAVPIDVILALAVS